MTLHLAVTVLHETFVLAMSWVTDRSWFLWGGFTTRAG